MTLQVTTRRTQGAEKAVIPTEDDPVNKLPGVGKETHTKLKNLEAAGIEYPLQNYNILKGMLCFRHSSLLCECLVLSLADPC